jgi:uncharacterized protein YciI
VERAAAPAEFDTFELVLLHAAPNRPSLPPDVVADIQSRHLGYLERMRREGHLLVAGPFSDQEDEKLRGMCLYHTGSLEATLRLASADPAVVEGRIEVSVMRWLTPRGRLAFGSTAGPAAP